MNASIRKSHKTLILFGILCIFFSFSDKKFSDQENVRWITFEQAVEMTKKNPKPIIIDVYTQWCGPCKLMSKNTFNHPKISKYINDNFYAVKFDAECHDTVKLKAIIPDTIKKEGKIVSIREKEQLFTFVNPSPVGTPRASHQFAVSILDGKLAYPSIVFLSPKIQRMDIKLGYHTAEQFEPILNYFGSNAYEKISFEEFKGKFVSQL